MLVDLSLKVDAEDMGGISKMEELASFGHLGTHFDVMDGEFPLKLTRIQAIAYDVRHVKDREINIDDIAASPPGEGVFAVFYSGFQDLHAYGTPKYHTEHPELSYGLIDFLMDSGVSLIGLDFAGMRRGGQHTPADAYCAARGVFVVENLCNLDKILEGGPYACFTANVYPVSIKGMTGLPCRVVGESGDR